MITLSDIQSSPQVIEDLDWPFDFSVRTDDDDDDTDWIQLKPPHPFMLIAEEGAGGVFLSYGEGACESLPILHATSEGQTGKVATDLTQLLAILMAIPYWRDLLKFSGGGQLDEMRKTALYMEKEFAADYPELPEARQRIMAILPVPTIDDPIKVLHDNVHATDCVPIAEDGSEYESLFNRFKSSDNPRWK